MFKESSQKLILPIAFFGVAIFIYLAYLLNPIILAAFVAFIIFAGIKPLVDYLETKNFKRWIAIVFSYSIVLILMSGAFAFIINSLVTQVRNVTIDISENYEERTESIQSFVNTNLPFLSDFTAKTIDDIGGTVNSNELKNASSSQTFDSITQNIGLIGSQGLRFLNGVVGGLFTLFTIVFVSIYMVIPREDFYKKLTRLFGKDPERILNKTLFKSKVALGAWLRGIFLLMLFIGLATFFIVLIPGIFVENYSLGRFALLLAIIAGLLEGLPNIGPILTFAITMLLAILLGSPLGVLVYLGLAMLALQQLEAILLVPVVMKKALDLNPIVSIFGLIAGFELSGTVIGALLALPVVGVLQIAVIEIINYRKENQAK
jgi:predicted PurR-regulated permease PerM